VVVLGFLVFVGGVLGFGCFWWFLRGVGGGGGCGGGGFLGVWWGFGGGWGGVGVGLWCFCFGGVGGLEQMVRRVSQVFPPKPHGS